MILLHGFGRTLEFHPSFTPFKGTLDDVRIWKAVRTQSEIEGNLFNHLTGTETGLAGYWRFQEAGGQVVFDSSANANRGWLGGAPTPLPPGGSRNGEP